MLDKKPSQSVSSLNVEAVIDCNVIQGFMKARFPPLSRVLSTFPGQPLVSEPKIEVIFGCSAVFW